MKRAPSSASCSRRARDRYVPPTHIGRVHAALGDVEPALHWVERTYDEGANSVAYMTIEPWYEPIRFHPRFRSILQRTGQQ